MRKNSPRTSECFDGHGKKPRGDLPPTDGWVGVALYPRKGRTFWLHVSGVKSNLNPPSALRKKLWSSAAGLYWGVLIYFLSFSEPHSLSEVSWIWLSLKWNSLFSQRSSFLDRSAHERASATADSSSRSCPFKDFVAFELLSTAEFSGQVHFYCLLIF